MRRRFILPPKNAPTKLQLEHQRRAELMTLFETSPVTKTATLSQCGQFRYMLSRIWCPDRPVLRWIMLNPSTADADRDDPTIRRCVSFAKQWEYGGIVVLNLFAFRATNPKLLKTVTDPVGPENDDTIRIESNNSTVVAAWGNGGVYLGRDRIVMNYLLANGRVNVFCLGTTATASPLHPLYVPDATKLKPYRGFRILP